MMKSAVMAGLALVLLSGTPAEAARNSCAATVAERLDRLNVDRAEVRGIFYEAQRSGGQDNDQVVRILAWVSLHSCRGYLVIDMSRHCTVRQVYGRGACDLGGAVETW